MKLGAIFLKISR